MNLKPSLSLFPQTHWIKAVSFIPNYYSKIVSYLEQDTISRNLSFQSVCAMGIIIPPIPDSGYYFRDQKKECKWREIITH